MKLERKGETLHVCAEIDITAENTEEIRQQILKEMSNNLKVIAFDLKNVDRIDSTGLCLLISIQNSLEKREAKLTILNSNDDISDMFKAMRLDHHFEIS